ncbi:MAG: DUF1003 domain-containing protein [archaeon]
MVQKKYSKKLFGIISKNNKLLAMIPQKNGHVIFKTKLTLGQKLADIVTRIAGSWTFILTFLMIFVLWVIFNVYFIFIKWDPYPFILLNLALSTLAALQAPVILMSQNRQAERDRLTAKYDYQVNRKAEREIQDIQKDLEEIKKLLKKRQ